MLLRKLGWLIGRRRKEAELEEELRFHLAEETEEFEAAGLAGSAARAAARRGLGSVALVQEEARAAWGWTWFEQFAQDVRYAVRTMAANKTFTVLAALSLALGIGANSAIYSFMDAILLRSLPVRDPGSLTVLNWRARPVQRPRGGGRNFVLHSMTGETWKEANGGPAAGIFPYSAFEFLRNNQVFSDLFAYCWAHRKSVTINGQSELLTGEYVSGDYFRGLGVVPAAGRMIAGDDDRAGAAPVAVLAMGLAVRRFGTAANAIGQSIVINNVPVTVTGVAPAEFFGVNPAHNPDFFLPMHTNLAVESSWDFEPGEYLDPHDYWVEMMGRLRPDVARAQAEAALAPAFRQWVAGTAANDRERANLPILTLRDGSAGLDVLRRRYSEPLYVLMGMVGLLLAIACANTANLLMARAAARRRELALRLSLGAGRSRIIRQLLTESVLLACAAGVFGVLLGFWGVRLLTVLLANGDERFTLRAELNWHVLAATLALSLLCGVLFGMAPAFRATGVDILPALKESRTGDKRRGRFSLSQGLVVSQIAVSLLMLTAAGLFVRTLATLRSVPLGFRSENVLLFDVNARQSGHREPEIAIFYAGLRRRLAAIPGVRAATLAHSSIIGAGRGLSLHVGTVDASDAKILNIGPYFFSTMRIPLLMGREPADRDGPGAPGIVVVNERFAKQYFGDGNPLGRRVTLGDGPHRRDMEVAGVCGDIRYHGLKEEYHPVVFIPYDQGDWPPVNGMTFSLRTAGDPLRYAAAVREIVRQADERIPVTEVMTQATEIARSINQEILFARLCSVFAGLALAIACVGLYATVAYQVARRTSEIGIRIALGARPGAVVWMVLRGVLVLSAAGLAISVPAAIEGSKLVKSFLFGVQPGDPLALACSGAILVATALMAAYVPARRAARVDAMRALRQE